MSIGTVGQSAKLNLSEKDPQAEQNREDTHRMTNDRHLRIHADATSESLEALQEMYGTLEAPTQLRRFCANRDLCVKALILSRCGVREPRPSPASILASTSAVLIEWDHSEAFDRTVYSRNGVNLCTALQEIPQPRRCKAPRPLLRGGTNLPAVGNPVHCTHFRAVAADSGEDTRILPQRREHCIMLP